MLGWILLVLFATYGIAAEGLLATLAGLGVAVGVDVTAALIIGTSFAEIFTGAGLADDVIMLAFSSELTYVEKVALAVFLEESHHVEHEAFEYYDHTDRENEQFSRWLQRQDPNATYLFGDVTPRDLFSLGASAGFLASKGTFGTILDAAKGKFGGLVTATSDVIAVGGA
jgi:hypothetical protein